VASGGAGGSKSPSSLSAPADSIPPGSMCEPDGWCWYNPRPSGAQWDVVAGAGRTDLWVGGETPQVLHSDGGRWSVVPSPLAATAGIWASAKNDVWFAGGVGNLGTTGAIAHWDGTAMTLVPQLPATSGFNGIWGSGPRDVYAVGNTTLHFDGTAWTVVPGVVGSTISGSGPNDVWVGSFDGMYHFDGTSWTRPPQFLGPLVQAVSVVGPNDLWVVTLASGSYSVEHFAGGNLSVSLQVPADTLLIFGLQATSDQDVWLVGGDFSVQPPPARGYLNHFDGSAWTRAPLAPTILIGVEDAPGLGTFSVGFDGGFVRLTAAPQPGFTDLRTGPAEDLLGTFGTAPTDMWAVGKRGTVLHFDGHAVTSVPSGTTADLTDVWGSGPADIWAVGTGGAVIHFDGQSFTSVGSGTSVNLNAVFTARPNDVWIGGDAGTLLHWDGSAMSPASLPAGNAPINDIHGLGPDDIWLVGGDFTSSVQTFAAHFDGTAWTLTVIGGSPLKRVWMLATNDVWATAGVVGSGESVGYAHFDGTSWAGPLPNGVNGQTRLYFFPNLDGGSFVFGPHDRWIVGGVGHWQRNTQ
jgi:hypothetical protein